MPVDVTPTKKTPSNRGSRGGQCLVEPAFVVRHGSSDYGALQSRQPFSDIAQSHTQSPQDGPLAAHRPPREDMRRPKMASARSLANVSSAGRSMVMTTENRANGKRLVCKWMDSPIGRLKLVATDQGSQESCGRERPGRVKFSAPVEDASHGVLVEAERQLSDWPRGRRQTFSLRLDFAGTEFPAPGVGRPADDSVWRNAVLRADCPPDRKPAATRASARQTAGIPSPLSRPVTVSSARPAL